MNILFISNNFPPEVNAPATRILEHATRWIRNGHTVEVVTSAPHFPEGRVYVGYENRFLAEKSNGIFLTRVPMFISANQGILKRSLSFLSFMFSVRRNMHRIQTSPDVVVATSPQFFAGLAGYLAGRKLKKPFVLEIRDLWPESIVAVGAMDRNAIIQLLERIELFLYRRADHIIVLTRTFKKFIVDKGIDERKISYVPNGADVEFWNRPLDKQRLRNLKRELGLSGKFIVSYIGTLGAAHKAELLLDAAKKCSDPEIMFLVVGTGASRLDLENRVSEEQPGNFILLDKVPREETRYLLAATHASFIHLRALPLFKTVIPSKMFEAMATGTPIILGVEGESKEIVEETGTGIAINPENVDALLSAVRILKENRVLYHEMVSKGPKCVEDYYNRERLAEECISVFERASADLHLK